MAPEIVREVRDTALERGRLTKGEGPATWPMSNDEYDELKKAVLKDKGFESGGRKVGGIVALPAKGRFPDEGESEEIELRTSWEKRSVERLVKLLEHKKIAELLGDLVQTRRQVRRRREGQARRRARRVARSVAEASSGAPSRLAS